MTITRSDTQPKTTILVSVMVRKKVLFIIPYPLREAPSQRFRFEQYFEALQANLIEYKVQTFLTLDNWRVFYGRGKVAQKATALMKGFWRRTVGLFDARHFDYIFIHREATPVGPPIFEWILVKVLGKKIIYDFDDAIWLTDNTRESVLQRLIKWRGKVSTICKLSYRISCGNSYLAAYACNFNSHVTINPTTIDMDLVHRLGSMGSVQPDKRTITVGWTGSHSTLKYLEMLEPVLQRIEQEHPEVSFLVIADNPPRLNLDRLLFMPWSRESEVEDLARLDIGIMPLPDDEWSKGKCGFKILQYMSLSIPSVSSAVGGNNEIVRHGDNGFLCSNDDEWLRYIKRLIQDTILRKKFGDAGRQTVTGLYSVNSNTPTFLSLFE